MVDTEKTRVLNLGQAASLADCSRDTLRRAAQREELAAELGPGKKGPQWWVREADLMDWLQGRRQTEFAPSGHSSPGQNEEVSGLESPLSEAAYFAEQADKAQQELVELRRELAQAQRVAEEATERLRVARTLIATFEQPARTARWKRVLQAITLGPIGPTGS